MAKIFSFRAYRYASKAGSPLMKWTTESYVILTH